MPSITPKGPKPATLPSAALAALALVTAPVEPAPVEPANEPASEPATNEPANEPTNTEPTSTDAPAAAMVPTHFLNMKLECKVPKLHPSLKPEQQPVYTFVYKCVDTSKYLAGDVPAIVRQCIIENARKSQDISAQAEYRRLRMGSKLVPAITHAVAAERMASWSPITVSKSSTDPVAKAHAAAQSLAVSDQRKLLAALLASVDADTLAALGLAKSAAAA